MEEGGASTRSLLFKSDEHSSSITFMLLFTTFVAICGSYAHGHALGYTSPAESGILKDLGLSLSEFSTFGSILTIGALIGAALSGKVADLIGRRGAMLVSDIVSIIGWLAITLSKGNLSLDFGRLLIGYGVGSFAYVVPTYLAEIAPVQIRGTLSSVNMFMMATGISVAFITGSWLNWRILALLGIIPCVVQLLGLLFIPDSPRWLAKVGHRRELMAALQLLRGKNSDIYPEMAEIIDHTERLRQITQDGFSELFRRKYGRAIIVGVGLMILQQFSGATGYSYYFSFIVESAGFRSDVGSVVLTVVQMLGCICCSILVDRIGRVPLLLVSSVGMCLGSLLTGLSFLLRDYELWKELTPIMTLTGILVYVGSICAGVAGIPWIITSEIFPINIKGAGGSFGNLVQWSASWIVSYTFNFLFEWSSAGVFFVYSIFAGLGVIVIAKLVPETNGCTLEEIQASISR